MESRTEGSQINLIVADHDTSWMMDITQDISSHPQVKVVGFAQSGKAAIDRAVSMAADAVLIEYAMPDLTAAEVARKLAEESPGTAVFAVSASITTQLVQTARAAGVAEIFPRDGFSAAEAAEKIARHIDGLRREWADAAKKGGVVDKGRGPKGERVRTEYVTRTMTQTVILTHNTKGGVGKSTVAINLATAIKMSPYLSGQRVAVVDFDCGGANVSTICGLPDTDVYNRNIATWEYLSEDLSAKEVDDLLLDGPHGLKIAAAPLNVAVSDRITVDLADKILRILKRYFGVIVIDGAPNISPPIDAAMYHATHILLVANPEGQSVKQLARIVQLVSPDPDYPEKQDLSHLLRKMFVVINHAQADNNWNLSAKDIANTVGRPVLAEIPNDESVKKALHSTSGKQAVEINPESPFAIAMKTLANDICNAYPEGVGGGTAKASGGFLAGLFGRRR